MTEIRLSSHKLMIERGRCLKMLPTARLCAYCHTIEDENHVVCVWPQYATIRTHNIKPYYVKKPRMFKFLQLLNTDKLSEMQKLATFLKRLFAIYNDQMHAYLFPIV